MIPLGDNSLDLSDLLEVIGHRPRAHWKVEYVSEVWWPERPPRFSASWDDGGLVLDDEHLRHEATAVQQVINGRFRAAEAGNETLVVEAIDSTFWIIWADDDELHRRLGEKFRNVAPVDLPSPFHTM